MLDVEQLIYAPSGCRVLVCNRDEMTAFTKYKTIDQTNEKLDKVDKDPARWHEIIQPEYMELNLANGDAKPAIQASSRLPMALQIRIYGRPDNKKDIVVYLIGDIPTVARPKMNIDRLRAIKTAGVKVDLCSDPITYQYFYKLVDDGGLEPVIGRLADAGLVGLRTAQIAQGVIKAMMDEQHSLFYKVPAEQKKVLNKLIEDAPKLDATESLRRYKTGQQPNSPYCRM